MRHRYIIQIREVYKTGSGKMVMILEYAEKGDLQEQVEGKVQNNQCFGEGIILSKRRFPGLWVLQF